MKVRDIMTSEELATATLDNTLEEIANMMRDENVGAIPVLDEDDKLAGIITDRDIVVRAIAEGQDPSSCTAEEILSEELHTIEPDADLEEAADLMARHKIRRLPVVEDGEVIGIISLGDISVKADDERAADTLEDISEGVKPAPAKSGRGSQQHGQRSDENGGRGSQQRGQRSEEGGGRRSQPQSQTRGATQRSGSVDSQFNAAGSRSSGEEVAAEETEYQRESASRMGRQQGSTRAENAQAGRIGNQSRSQQSKADDLVNNEGEEEAQSQSAGGGAVRQRANQQTGSRQGAQAASGRGRETGQSRGSERSQASQQRQQGITNRSAAEERKGQQKVTGERDEAHASGRNRNKKRAS
jgi:CBS domain-containing protein